MPPCWSIPSTTWPWPRPSPAASRTRSWPRTCRAGARSGPMASPGGRPPAAPGRSTRRPVPLAADGGSGVPTGWAAVIVNSNAGSALDACVASVLAQDPRPEVVVVDNASTDGSVDGLLRAHPGVRVVRSGGNLGYARAANLGIAATSANVVAVLNPDTVVRPGAGAALTARFAAEPDLGAAGPRLQNSDGSVYPSARRLPGLPDAVGHGLLF